MVAPDAVVGHVDPLFARGIRGHDRAISVDERLVEECGRLLFPDTEPGLIDSVHQIQNIPALEPPAEIAGGGGIGNPLGPQGIEVDLVVTSQFEMLELVSSGQDVEGDVQHVIGLMVRQVTLEEMEPAVDVVNQSALAGY